METVESWKAKILAKTFLQGIGTLSIQNDYGNKFDLVAVNKANENEKFGVIIKSIGNNKTTYIRSKYSSVRTQYSRSNMPVIIIYVDALHNTGYFEIKKRGIGSSRIVKLSNTVFRKELSHAKAFTRNNCINNKSLGKNGKLSQKAFNP